MKKESPMSEDRGVLPPSEETAGEARELDMEIASLRAAMAEEYGIEWAEHAQIHEHCKVARVFFREIFGMRYERLLLNDSMLVADLIGMGDPNAPTPDAPDAEFEAYASEWMTWFLPRVAQRFRIQPDPSWTVVHLLEQLERRLSNCC